MLIAALPAAFAVLGDTQFLPGYAVLLVDAQDVTRLTDMPRRKRLQFLASMDLLGEAVENTCRRLDPAFRRVNLEILGNTDPFLHAHIWPRYDWEPPDKIGGPVWRYPKDLWADVDPTDPAVERRRGLLAAEVHSLARAAGPVDQGTA